MKYATKKQTLNTFPQVILKHPKFNTNNLVNIIQLQVTCFKIIKSPEILKQKEFREVSS